VKGRRKTMIRNVREDDYSIVIESLNDWWGGRNMTDMLPRLFFVHFQESSFIFEEAGKIVGFLIGFISNTYKDIAYIHFVGVDPDFRKNKIAAGLYTRFTEYCLKHGVSNIKCVTSPVNKV
jgi:predicted GNAT superfamily acetyltransferase